MNSKIQKKEIDLLDIWRLALKRKWIIISLALVLAIITAVRSYMKTPVYMAQATILIEEPSAGMMNLDELMNQGAFYRNDFLGTYFNTQLKLLTSRSLAERVARNLDLANSSEFQGNDIERRSIFQTVRNLFSFSWLKTRKAPNEEDQSGEIDFHDFQDRNALFAGYVLSGLRIRPIEETRLVNLDYYSSSPEMAAEIVNSITREFINFTVEMRYGATRQAQEFLDSQIDEIQGELAAKQRDIQKYSDEKDILYTSETENTVLSQFSETNNEYNKARLETVNKEAIYRNLQSLDVDDTTAVVDNPIIQSLQTSYTAAKVEYEEKSKTYLSKSPVLMKLSAKISGLREQLQNEIAKAVDAAQREYQVARRKENSLKKMLDGQRAEVQDSQSDAILYKSLTIEVANKRELLSSLISKRDETLVSARLKGLKSSNIKIIDPALIPGGPVPLNTGRNVGIAILLGLFIGVGLSFFIDYVDNTVKDPEELEEMVNLPSLGTIPYFTPNGSRKRSAYRANYYRYTYGGNREKEEEALAQVKDIELINHNFPNLAIAEDYRTIRTSILFSHAEAPPKVITFTSSFPQEGKSATVSNLSVSFSQLEKKVLLIDSDLRRPRLHKIFDLKNLKGLSSYLTGRIPLDEAVQKTQVKNLWIMTSGPHPPNPAELLDSRKMKELISLVKERFDVILIDSPPLLAVIDPVILSSISDGTIIVIRQGKTTKKALMKAIEEVNKASASHIIGMVFNEVKHGREAGYYHSQYGNYMDTYSEEK